MLISIENDDYRADIFRYAPRIPLFQQERYLLKITDRRSGTTWQPSRDLLDGRGQGIKAEILGIRWISKDELRIERRVTEEGLRQDLRYGIFARSFRDMQMNSP